jgi:hypothetical protein
MSQLAFPTAMGAGAYTSGGRGQIIYHVTNLNDSGAGSFRQALLDADSSNGGTIVFDVSGVINLTPTYSDNKRIIIGNNNLTIAGQTAPEGGITITGAKLYFTGNNIIIRYLKFRSTNNVDGCLQSNDGNNIIFDHLSGSHVESNEVTFGMTSNNAETINKTIQNCLVTNSGLGFILGDTTPPNDTHNETQTIINNLSVNVGWRVPGKIGGPVRMDIVNNTVHNHTSRLIRIDDWSYTLNHVGNYYSKGGRGVTQSNTAYYGTNSGLIYEHDNYYDPAFPRDDWTDFDNPRTDPLPSSSFSLTAFSFNNPETLNILSKDDLKVQVLPYVGAFKYINDSGEVVEDRDSIDSTAITQAITESQSETSVNLDITLNEIPTQNNTRPNDFYQSNPHISEDYLVSRGITGTSTIHNEVQPSGYTLLEEYANQVDQVEVLAFPTAVGAGAYATGGRGGKVCHVDTLTWDTAVVYDAATDSYSGGFYNMFYELDIPAKEIVFIVSGTIVVPSTTVLNFASKTNEGNITVSGQTSNIVFSTDYLMIQNAKNIIWRYTSFYKRDDQSPGADVLWVTSVANDITENIIFDHCSFYYGGDECFSITSSNGEVNNITVQWSLMAASSKGSIIGAYTGQSNATTAYCSYQDISYRFPNMLGYGSNSQQDAYNIFVGNYTSRLIRTTGDANFNVQNMYVQANRANYGRHRMQYQSTAPCQLYAGGTIITGVQDIPAYPEFDDVWTTFSGSDIGANLPIPSDARASSAFPLVGEPSTIFDTDQVKTQVLPYTGNTKRLANDGSVIEDEYPLDPF